MLSLVLATSCQCPRPTVPSSATPEHHVATLTSSTSERLGRNTTATHSHTHRSQLNSLCDVTCMVPEVLQVRGGVPQHSLASYGGTHGLWVTVAGVGGCHCSSQRHRNQGTLARAGEVRRTVPRRNMWHCRGRLFRFDAGGTRIAPRATSTPPFRSCHLINASTRCVAFS